jgi:hypothetical protein
MKSRHLIPSLDSIILRNSWCFLLVFLACTTSSFLIFPIHHRRHSSSGQLYSILDNDEKSSDQVDFDSFNPLSYKATQSNSAYSFSGTQISLRKTRMQELNNELLNVVGDEDETQQVLQEYKYFLLEPLEDLEAVLVRSFCVGALTTHQKILWIDGRIREKKSIHARCGRL